MLIIRRPDRRTALKVAVAAALPAWVLPQLRADEPKTPADKPKIALIGCGGMGKGDATNAKRFGTVVAVCDVDAGRRDDRSRRRPGDRGPPARGCRDLGLRRRAVRGGRTGRPRAPRHPGAHGGDHGRPEHRPDRLARRRRG